MTEVPAGDDEHLRRIRVEAEALANENEVDRSYLLPRRAEEIGVAEKVLRSAVRAVLNERARRVAAGRLEQDRERKRQEEQRDAEQRELERIRKAEEKARQTEEKEGRQLAKEAERQAERERRKAEKAALQKAKAKVKAIGNIARLPVARHEPELNKLAARLGEDVATLRREFEEFIGVGGGDVSAARTEPWHEPVDAAELLDACGNKTRKHVAIQDLQLTTAVLWTAHAWLYDHDVPTHSPILAATSAEPDSGKTTLVTVVGRMSPRFSLNVELTGPALFYMIDARKPTVGIDEADDLFLRKGDLKSVVNAGWTRTAKVPRTVSIGGARVTVFFDVFTPKAIALLGRNLPPATRSRRIELRMVPKRRDEQVADFDQLDDPEFAVLRRKFARWAADNAAALKDARPVMPANLNNRDAANWKLLLAIAELAGGPWPERAREAAERLTRTGRRPSDGVRLLAALKEIFASCTEITSASVEAKLREDPHSIWVEFNKGRPITQRQIALLLDAYDIQPTLVGVKRLSGYRVEQFKDAFARYLSADPLILSGLRASIAQPYAKRQKQKKQNAKRQKQKKRSTKRQKRG